MARCEAEVPIREPGVSVVDSLAVPGVDPVRTMDSGCTVATAPAARRRPRRRVIVAVLVLLALSIALTVRVIDSDSGADLVGLLRATGADVARLRWQFTVLVIALAAVHYLATAVAARAASGLRLPLGEATLAQLAAATANRLSPAGLGGSAVNGRYFARRGLPAASAVGAVVVLTVLGAVADLLVLAGILGLGRLLGLGNPATEFATLAAKVSGLVRPLRSGWTWLVVVVLVAALWLARRRLAARTAAIAVRFLAPVRVLARRPRALATLLLASGSTTLLLGVAFVLTTIMVPGRQPHLGVGALLVGFMLASAAGNAVPVPAGIGSTETALIAVLVVGGLPAGQSGEIVLIFRLVTFWLPAVAGVFAGRRLRRSGAL